MSIWSRMTSWFTQSSKRYVLCPIPGQDDKPIVADRAYLRIWLVEMRLSKSRNWFKDYQPAVHALVKLKFADQTAELARVAAPDKDKFAGDRAVLENYPLLDLAPFRGGTVELDAALIAVKGDDQLGKAISAIAGFAGLVAAPLAGALAIATKVKEGADLLFDEGGEVQLAYHNTFGGEGGANRLVPGYIAIVLAETNKLDASTLCVQNDKLCVRSNAGATPLVGYDHMLLRVESVAARDDLQHFTAIATLRDKAIDAYLRGATDEAENAFRAALSQIAVHPELINSDKRVLIEALRQDVDAYRQAAHAAAPPPEGRLEWSALVDKVGRGQDVAPISADELEGWLRRN